MSKFGRKQRPAPEGFEYIEPTLTALDNELREKVNEPHEGLRKSESQWPVHQINWQKSRYVYNMHYKYKKISREVYDYCIENKMVDAALIAKWKKPGYEKLCSTYVINPKNFKFNTVSLCRVPKSSLPAGAVVEDPVTGCRGCASGSSEENIFGNKYGQDLALIQIVREEKEKLRAENEVNEVYSENEDNDNGDCVNSYLDNEEQQDKSENHDDEHQGFESESDSDDGFSSSSEDECPLPNKKQKL